MAANERACGHSGCHPTEYQRLPELSAWGRQIRGDDLPDAGKSEEFLCLCHFLRLFGGIPCQRRNSRGQRREEAAPDSHRQGSGAPFGAALRHGRQGPAGQGHAGGHVRHRHPCHGADRPERGGREPGAIFFFSVSGL